MDTLPGMLAADVYLTVLAVENLLRQYLKKGISRANWLASWESAGTPFTGGSGG
jgi:hypothetical protein